LSGLTNLTYSDSLLKLNNADTLKLRHLKLDLSVMLKIYYKLVHMILVSFSVLTLTLVLESRAQSY